MKLELHYIFRHYFYLFLKPFLFIFQVGFFKRNRKIKEISGPTGNEAENPQKNPQDFDDDDDDDD